MAWARLDDGFPEHPKVLAVGPFGLAVFVRALCYSARNLTDGFIPDAAIASFTVDFARTSRAAHAVDWPARLVEAGLWDVVDGGYQIHDYLAYNPSKEKVLAERRAVADRVKRWRVDHRNAQCNGVTGDNRNAVTNGGVTGAVTPPPSPSPPLPVEEEGSSFGRSLSSEPRATSPKKAPETGALATYLKAWEVRYGFQPTPTAQDCILVNRVLKPYSEEERAAIVEAYLADDDEWICKQTHRLGLLAKRIDTIRARLRGTATDRASRKTSDTAFPPTRPVGTKYADTPTVRL